MNSTAENMENLTGELLSCSGNPREGLPKPIFYFVSQLTPMINVDLLIKNDHSHTLLTWRDDEFFGPGWHVPGGIIRFKEQMASRIQKVAETELGCKVRFHETPTAINEVMAPHRDIRGHFISLLFECQLMSEPDPVLKFQADMPMHGHWEWHATSPENLIPVHEMYRNYINANFEQLLLAPTQ